MTKDGYRQLIEKATIECESGDNRQMDLLIENLIMLEEIKQILLDNGFLYASGGNLIDDITYLVNR